MAVSVFVAQVFTLYPRSHNISEAGVGASAKLMNLAYTI
jgi:hypothetical protein